MTTQCKELSEFQHSEIIGAWKCREFCEKLSERKISEILGYPKSTVHEVIAAYRDHGIEKPSSRSGRPRCRSLFHMYEHALPVLASLLLPVQRPHLTTPLVG